MVTKQQLFFDRHMIENACLRERAIHPGRGSLEKPTGAGRRPLPVAASKRLLPGISATVIVREPVAIGDKTRELLVKKDYLLIGVELEEPVVSA